MVSTAALSCASDHTGLGVQAWAGADGLQAGRGPAKGADADRQPDSSSVELQEFDAGADIALPVDVATGFDTAADSPPAGDTAALADTPSFDAIPDFGGWDGGDLGTLPFDSAVFQELPPFADTGAEVALDSVAEASPDGQSDAVTDAIADAVKDSAVDTGTGDGAISDSGGDAGETLSDAVQDGQVDGKPEIAPDSVAETVQDAVQDGGQDAAQDAVPDTALDGGAEIAADAATDSGSQDSAGDAPADVLADTVSDAVSDSAADSAADASSDTPSETTSETAADITAETTPETSADTSAETSTDTSSDTGPCSAAACDDGEPCTLDLCGTNGVCSYIALDDGDLCAEGTCQKAICSRNTPTAYGLSCKAIKSADAKAKNGVWWLDPDGPFTPVSPFAAWCDMQGDGGGWTLIAKVGATASELGYDAAHWTTIAALHPQRPRFDDREAKLTSFWSVPFKQLRIGLKSGNQTTWLVADKTASSLFHVLKDGTFSQLAVPEGNWLGLLPNAQLHSACAVQGFNVHPGIGSPFDYARARIGIVGSIGTCSTPASRIGLGLGGATCGQSAAVAAGNSIGCLSGGTAVNLPAVGYIFAR
ncbi:MAG: hypothetical protein EXR77_10530 [Myxococcales bacterium]|nr:hypothetical protein [Myxococcales bacterium]